MRSDSKKTTLQKELEAIILEHRTEKEKTYVKPKNCTKIKKILKIFNYFYDLIKKII